MALNFIPTDANHEEAEHLLGEYQTWNGNVYQYVKFKDAVTYAAGQVVWWDDASAHEVTNDESSAEADWIPAGIVLRVMTQNYHGWILKKGYYATAKKLAGDDSIAMGTQLIPDNVTPTDGTLKSYLVDPSSAGSPSDAELQAMQRATAFSRIFAAGASDDPNDTVPVMVDLI